MISDQTPELLAAMLKEMTFYSSVAMTAMARWLGFFFIFPFFRWVQMPGPVRNASCLALSLPVWPSLTQSAAASKMPIFPNVGSQMGDLGFAHFIGIIGITSKEFIIGVLLGILPAAFFYGLIFIGELLDQACNDSNQSPSAGEGISMTNTGLVFFVSAGMMFFQSGAFLNMVLLFYDTYDSLPIYDNDKFFQMQRMHTLSVDAINLIVQSIYTGWPFLILLLSFHALTFFQNKIDKKFHGSDAIPPIRSFIFILALFIYLKYSSTNTAQNDMLLRSMRTLMVV